MAPVLRCFLSLGFAAVTLVTFHVVLHVGVVLHRRVMFHLHVARISTAAAALVIVSVVHVLLLHFA